MLKSLQEQDLNFYHPKLEEYDSQVSSYKHMTKDGDTIPICNAMGGSVTLPATFRNFGIIFKHYNELAQNFMIVMGSSTISQMYEVSSGVIDCGSQRHDSLFNYHSILEECIRLDGNKEQAAKNLKKFCRHLKKVSGNSSLTDFTKTIPLSITLVSLGKTAKGWDHNCDANSWMGGGIGGFLFCVKCDESSIDDSSEDMESRNESSVTTGRHG